MYSKIITGLILFLYEGLYICLFFECSNALSIWSWVQQTFPTFHFSNKDNLLSFIKSNGSHLVKLIKFVVITFSI